MKQAYFNLGFQKDDEDQKSSKCAQWNVNAPNHIMVYRYGMQLLEVRDIYNECQNKVIYYPDVLSAQPEFISDSQLAVVT